MSPMLLPPRSSTLCGLLDEVAGKLPDYPAVTWKDKTWTYSELRLKSIACAKAMYALGIRSGDKIGILMGNRPEWIACNFGAQYLGATMVALNTWYTKDELLYVLNHSDISLLISSDSFLKGSYFDLFNSLTPMKSHAPAVRQLIMLGEQVAKEAISYDTFLRNGISISDKTINAASSQLKGEDEAYILYTSGSTAHPKGVILIHKHLVGNMYDIGVRMRFTPGEVVFMPLSLFWGMGCMNMLIGPIAHGAHLVLQEVFDPDEALSLIEKYRCSVFPGTANIIHAVLEHPNRSNYDISSLRTGTPIGAPESSRKAIDSYLPDGIRCYGLTETHGFATMHDVTDPVDQRATNEGRVMPGFLLKIVEPSTGREMPLGKSGEIRLKGRIMKGYYKNPEATAEALDSDGWFKTGDIGVINEQGYLTFHGRFKEMLKTGGINVAPVEVENVLLRHPGVQEAFVCGLPDPIREQIVAAVVVPRSGFKLSESELVTYCKESLAAYKIPRRFVFVRMDQLPQTASRKVHRLRLHTLFEGPAK